MKMPLICAAVMAAATCSAAQANCYTVYGRGDVLFQSVNTPVDLSRNLSETVPTRFGPGTTLVIWSNDEGCVEVAGPGTYSMGGGVPRPSNSLSISNTGSASGAPRRTPDDPPASLDRVFQGQDNQMRGSLGSPVTKGNTLHMGPNGSR